jgi:hypothetical protein
MARQHEEENASLCMGERAGLDYPCDRQATAIIERRCDRATFSVCAQCAQELAVNYGFKASVTTPFPSAWRDPCPH